MRNTECTTADLGDFEGAVLETLQSFDQQNLIQRIWQKDPSLWSSDPAVQKKIQNRLGWLTVADEMTGVLDDILAFSEDIKKAGFCDVVLLGMGGSSLCPEVLNQCFASAAGTPKLTVLDTTDPETILSTERGIDLKKTLFILASKSGNTIEMLSLYRYFEEKIRVLIGENVGAHFMAITDPGSSLGALAREKGFRKIFLNMPDIGGRYSALSYFGLVPAALIGIDPSGLLKRASAIMTASSASTPTKENPCIILGAILGTLGQSGRDKMTLVTSRAISSFGLWVEQLVAESTGKAGKGIVPIDRELLAEPSLYAHDRLFVYLRLDSDDNPALDQKLTQLKKGGHPVVQIDLQDRLDLAGEFFRWELATAVAGYMLQINPFDEPNVSESKENTAQVLERFEAAGELPFPDGVSVEGGLRVSGTLNPEWAQTLAQILQHFLSSARANDYIAIMAYLPPTKNNDVLLQTLRAKILKKYHLATTLGYGPRFLHSTGQLHKGGGRCGRFIQITMEDKKDIAIPGSNYSFGILKRAQALGDFHSLIRQRLPVIDIRLGEALEADLENIVQSLNQ